MHSVAVATGSGHHTMVCWSGGDSVTLVFLHAFSRHAYGC